MVYKILWIVTIALYVQCEEEAISEQKVTIHHQKSDQSGLEPNDDKKKYEYHDEYNQAYPSYEFSYKVNDPITHDIKGQHETREGDEVKGIYWLVDPNGHKRTVNYQANDDNGFNAQVALTGYLQVEENKSQEQAIVAVKEKANEENTDTKVNYEVKDDNIEKEANEDNQAGTEETTENNQETKLDDIELNSASSTDRRNKYDQNRENTDHDEGPDSYNERYQESRGRKKSYAKYEESRLAYKTNKRENFNEKNQERTPSTGRKSENGSSRTIGSEQKEINLEENKLSNNRGSLKDKNQERIPSSEKKIENGSNKKTRTDQRNYKYSHKENVNQNDDLKRYLQSRNKINTNQNINTRLNNRASDNGVRADNIEQNIKSQDDDADERIYKNNKDRSNSLNHHNTESVNTDTTENINRRNTIDKKVEIYEHKIRIHHPKHIHNNPQT